MRRRALEILVRVEAGEGFAAEHLAGERAPFLREVVHGVLRRRLTLDTILAPFGRRPLEDLDPPVRNALRLGLYQILFLDGVPPHAAVSESVGAVPLASQRSYVNAVLRQLLRESHKVAPERDRGGAHPTKRFERPGRSVTFFSRPVLPDPATDRVGWLAAVHSHPPFLVARWVERVGEAAAVARMQAANRTPPVVLRPRAGRVDAQGLVAALAREGLAARVLPRPPGADAVEVAPDGAGLIRSKAFRRGLFSVQDPEQMDAAEILDPRPGEAIWDAAAAPGGKATQLAEGLAGQGRLLATDVSAERLSRLAGSVARLGLEGVEVAVHDLLGGGPPPSRPEGGFDAVLLDAPCSNTAVLGRRPEARWRLTPDTFARMAALQERMIAAAKAALAPGGRLVYSVCSREPEEGEAHGLAPTRSPLVWRGGPEA